MKFTKNNTLNYRKKTLNCYFYEQKLVVKDQTKKKELLYNKIEKKKN